MKRNGIYCALVAILSLSFSLGARAEDKERSPIKIGVVYGFTGAAQVWSEYGRMGLELALDEINQKGINGRTIALLFEDSKSIPAQFVSAYQKLRNIDNVDLIIGNVWSYLTNPLIPLAARDRTVLFSPTAMPESIEHTNQFFFSMGERISSIREAVDQFFKVNSEVKKVGVFCWEDTWGQAYLKIWNEVAAANGVEVIARACTSDFTSDFKTDVAKMLSTKVDAVIIAHKAETVLRRLREHRFVGKVLATSNIVEDIKMKGSDEKLFEEVFVTDWRPSEEFLDKFRSKFNQEPVAEAHNSYETLRALAMALSSSETDLPHALKGIKYSGVAGPIDFSFAPFVNLSIAKLYKVQRGDFVLVDQSRPSPSK